MDIYSKLNGTIPVSPASNGVWKIQKKRRTDDRKGPKEKKKKRNRDEKDPNDNPNTMEQEEMSIGNSPETEVQIGYGSAKKKNRAPLKIDLTI